MPLSSEELDNHYGQLQAREPRNWERNAAPIVKHALNQETADLLIAARDFALNNPFAMESITNLTFLWVVAEDGTIFLT